MLTYEEVSELLEYRPDVGGSCLVRKKDVYSGKNKIQVRAGDIAGHKRKDGYWSVCVEGKYYKAHRLIWLLTHGEWPECHIDHIKGKEDNRAEHLRLAKRNWFDNNQNTLAKRNNSSGHVGVDFYTRRGLWRARISENKKCVLLGYFPCKEEAIAAYLEAKAHLHTFSPVPR